MNSIDYRIIPTGEIDLNQWEVANRLKITQDFKSPEIDECLVRLKEIANCKFSAVRVPIKRLGGNRLECGFGEFESAVLLKNFKDSTEVFVFAATIGMGIERELNKLKQTSPARYFITDALASAMAESVAEKTQELVCNGLKHRPRFSPGFGDLGLELQPRILSLVNAQRLLGITINNSYIMTPGKSVTALIGIKDEKVLNYGKRYIESDKKRQTLL